MRNNRMLIQLPGDVLFDSGQETLKKEGKKILLQVAEVDPQRRGPVQARSSRSPATPTRSRSRAAPSRTTGACRAMRARERARAAHRRRTDKGGGGLNPTNWSAAGYGDTDPVATNDTDEGRRRTAASSSSCSPNVEEMLEPARRLQPK